jgi:hypothetical protein
VVGSSLYAPGNFYNLTQDHYIGAPGSGVSPYTPDLSRPAFNQLYQKDNSLRLTWQASTKDKVTASARIQNNCTCHYAES